MSLFPLPTNPQSVKSNALVVGPNTSGGMYLVSNPVPGSTGTNDSYNYVISSGNNPIYFQIQPTYGGNVTAGLTLTSNQLTSTVPIVSPPSPGSVIYQSPVLITTTKLVDGINMAIAGVGGTPLPVGLYMLTVFTDINVQPIPARLLNGGVTVPVYWDGTYAYADFSGTVFPTTTTISNGIVVYTSLLPADRGTIGPNVMVDVTYVLDFTTPAGIPWSWALRAI